MKKLLVLTAVFALALAGCDDGNDAGNADVIGTWIDKWGEITLEIGNGTFTIFLGDNLTGTWTRQGSLLTLKGRNFSGSITLTGEGQMRIFFSYYESNVMRDLIKKGSGASFEEDTLLTIRNESSFSLSDLQWSHNSSGPGAIPPSYSTSFYLEGVFNDLTGYLYFSLRATVFLPDGSWTEWTNCRTSESITVSKGEAKVFTVTNNTLVVELNDLTNTPKRLQDIVSPVP